MGALIHSVLEALARALPHIAAGAFAVVTEVIAFWLTDAGLREALGLKDPRQRALRLALELLASLAILLSVLGLLLPVLLPPSAIIALPIETLTDLLFPVGLTLWVAVGWVARSVIPEPDLEAGPTLEVRTTSA